MSQPSSVPTRTAEALATPVGTPAQPQSALDQGSPDRGSRGRGSPDRGSPDRGSQDGGTPGQATPSTGAARTARTEVVPIGAVDAAAVSFALERERVLARTDHLAAVLRLRRALTLGVIVWAGAATLDVFVTQVGGEGSLRALLLSRGIATLVVLGVLLRLRRRPEPSARMLGVLDLLAFTTVSVCITINTLNYRGLDSPYAAGVLVVMLGRGATTFAPWQKGAWLFGIPALAYPLTLLAAVPFDERIARQLSEPAALGALGSLLFMLAVSWFVLVFGGHFAWRLSREAMEARNIGRYELERRLGSGGMADVWAAYDRTLKQRVALKTVYGHRPGSSVVARFEREVRALAGLTHPNTVRVFDYGATDDGLWYYAMELLQGETLHQLVAREGPLETNRLLSIARQALRALCEAHHKGIIHRDIKPENVFVAVLGGEPDVVKLLDFGVAKALASGDSTLTIPGFVVGTPAYVAPEVILGRPGDARSDIYSFGALLYYTASGRVPFADEGAAALFAAHLSRPPEPLSDVAPGRVPAALQAVIERCMAKDPEERFASTEALLDALQGVAAYPSTASGGG